MTKTPTVHNPTNFDPANYEVFDYLDNKRPEYMGGPVEAWAADIKWWEADMLRTFGDAWRSKIHRCVHCGNTNIRYITAVDHIPTGERVVFGSDCTERLGFADRKAWKLAVLKSKAEAGHARLKIWKARTNYLEAHPEIATAIETAKLPAHANNVFVKDVLSKLDTYGYLTDNQAAAVVKSLARDLEYAARKASEAIEVKGPAPSGKATVTGTVLSMKWVETSFGTTHKMLLKLTNNSRVWVTVPSKATLERGDSVSIKATWTPSRDDASFGFGSRPSLISRSAGSAPAPEGPKSTESLSF